ncbi:MAG: FtsX-like permease family protein [Armatimonadota bacterium]
MSVASTSGAASPKPSSVRQQVELPFAKAYEFALRSIKIRFWRSMITAGGVFLGIAFLASVLTSKAIAGPDIDPKEVAKMNWLVALSLLVCAVGITNSMLMSVTERFREIGTMKCLGALNQFIVKIFMIEALLMGIIASCLGWALGTSMIILSKLAAGVPANAPAGTVPLGSLSGTDVLLTLAFCVPIGAALTALATYIPARQAASIPPAAALRTDV